MEERKQSNENQSQKNKMNYILFYHKGIILQEECRVSQNFRQLPKHILMV